MLHVTSFEVATVTTMDSYKVSCMFR